MISWDRTLYEIPDQRSTGEARDCVVRALGLATNTSYTKAWDMLRHYGRKTRRGTTWATWLRLIDAEYPTAKRSWYAKSITVADFVKQCPTGSHVVFTRGHALAVLDGTVHNWKPNARSRVHWVWSFTLSSSLPTALDNERQQLSSSLPAKQSSQASACSLRQLNSTAGGVTP